MNATAKEITEAQRAVAHYLTEQTADSLAVTLMVQNNNLRATNARANTIIARLVSEDPCRLDHHGYCQTHLWFSEGECPHAAAKRFLFEKG